METNYCPSLASCKAGECVKNTTESHFRMMESCHRKTSQLIFRRDVNAFCSTIYQERGSVYWSKIADWGTNIAQFINPKSSVIESTDIFSIMLKCNITDTDWQSRHGCLREWKNIACFFMQTVSRKLISEELA